MNIDQENGVDRNENTFSQRQFETDLIISIDGGNEVALERLYHLYYSRLFRFIARVAGRRDFIDDVINDVMYLVWKNAGKFNQHCLPSTWIFGIAYNKTLQNLRGANKVCRTSLEAMDSESLSFGQDDSGIKHLEMTNWLEHAFTVLSPEQRAVIELTYFHGMHYREISLLMKCPENTVKTRMYHARKKLAPILKRVQKSTGDND